MTKYNRSVDLNTSKDSNTQGSLDVEIARVLLELRPELSNYGTRGNPGLP